MFTRTYAESLEVKKLLDGLDTCLPMSLSALMVMSKRYLQRDPVTGAVIETPEQRFYAIAEHLGETLAEVEDFYRMLTSFDFLPGGRTIATIGTARNTVSNCVVLDLVDTLDDILDKQRDAGILQKAGSGIGFPFHRLRPAGSMTRRDFGVSSGPVSFIHCFDTTFGVVKARNRNGANMGAMSVHHPDILEFIGCKRCEGALANFNISVGITDAFMEAVLRRDKTPWMCEFDGSQMLPRRIVRDKNYNIVDITPVRMTALEIFAELVDCAYLTGEPGMLFMDTINESNPLPGLGRIETTNPCGEQPLHGGDACNLGSINMSNMLDKGNDIDATRFENTIRLAVRMLDNVIDHTTFPIDYVDATVKANRRVGLGIMGVADMFAKMGIRYGSESAQMLIEEICCTLTRIARDESTRIGLKKGKFANSHLAHGPSRRNAALTTIAPTGSIALLAGVNGGMEPYFAHAYFYRGIFDGTVTLTYRNPVLVKALRENGCDTPEIMDAVVSNGSIQQIDGIPDKIKNVFVTAMDITPTEHTLMQASAQVGIDTSVSKTVNFPETADRSDIAQVFCNAWRYKCKGVTVYRDRCRKLQVLNIAHAEKCPDCGTELRRSEGCMACPQCGFSKCERSV